MDKALELADGLEDAIEDPWNAEEWVRVRVKEAANMLRQQQAEIAELKHINRNWQISENILLLELEKLQHRELTDEEIYEIGKQYLTQYEDGLNDFAKAILRKAQEK